MQDERALSACCKLARRCGSEGDTTTTGPYSSYSLAALFSLQSMRARKAILLPAAWFWSALFCSEMLAAFVKIRR